MHLHAAAARMPPRPHANHFQAGRVDAARGAAIGDHGGEVLRQSKLLVKLPKRQESGVAGQLPGGGLDNNFFATEEIKSDWQFG